MLCRIYVRNIVSDIMTQFMADISRHELVCDIVYPDGTVAEGVTKVLNNPDYQSVMKQGFYEIEVERLDDLT